MTPNELLDLAEIPSHVRIGSTVWFFHGFKVGSMVVEYVEMGITRHGATSSRVLNEKKGNEPVAKQWMPKWIYTDQCWGSEEEAQAEARKM